MARSSTADRAFANLPAPLPREEQARLCLELAAAREMADARKVEQLRSVLVTRHQRLVLSLARPAARRYELEPVDVFQSALVGLLVAIDRYDARHPSGANLATFARDHIAVEVHRSRDDARLVRLPRHVHVAHDTIRRARARLAADLGVELPDVEAVARASGLPVASVVRDAAVAWGSPSSLDCGDDVAEVNALRSDDELPDDAAVRHEREALTRHVLARLPDPRQREVLAARFGVGAIDGEARTLDEIAVAMAITRERVRQIEDRALESLRRRVREGAIR